jgi:hypothetical protein
MRPDPAGSEIRVVLLRPDERWPTGNGRYSRRSKIPCRQHVASFRVVTGPARHTLKFCCRVSPVAQACRDPVAGQPAGLAGAPSTARRTLVRLEKRGILPEARLGASPMRQRAVIGGGGRCACATRASFLARRLPAAGCSRVAIADSDGTVRCIRADCYVPGCPYIPSYRSVSLTGDFP